MICGLPVAKKCKWCGATAEYLCDWPMMRKVGLEAGKLQVGQVLERGYGTLENRRPWKIMSIAPYASGSHGLLEITFFDGASGKTDTIVEPPGMRIPVWRKTTCSEPMCEAHARELDPKKHYCKAHWDAWQTAEKDANTQMAIQLVEEGTE